MKTSAFQQNPNSQNPNSNATKTSLFTPAFLGFAIEFCASYLACCVAFWCVSRCGVAAKWR